MYRITDWIRYEVTNKGRPAAEGDELRAGPLLYYRAKIHGHSLGNGYRRLQTIAGNKSMEVFGIFHKFLEIAGNSGKSRRGGILRAEADGEPATAEDLAYLLNVPQRQIDNAIKVLCHPKLRWLEEIVPGNSRNLPESPGSLQEYKPIQYKPIQTNTNQRKQSGKTAARADEFDQFWSKVPNKLGKGKAREAFKRARKKVPLETILSGIPKYIAYEKERSAAPDYRPLHPATWLNGERWEDEFSDERSRLEAEMDELIRKGLA